MSFKANRGFIVGCARLQRQGFLTEAGRSRSTVAGAIPETSSTPYGRHPIMDRHPDLFRQYQWNGITYQPFIGCPGDDRLTEAYFNTSNIYKEKYASFSQTEFPTFDFVKDYMNTPNVLMIWLQDVSNNKLSAASSIQPSPTARSFRALTMTNIVMSMPEYLHSKCTNVFIHVAQSLGERMGYLASVARVYNHNLIATRASEAMQWRTCATLPLAAKTERFGVTTEQFVWKKISHGLDDAKHHFVRIPFDKNNISEEDVKHREVNRPKLRFPAIFNPIRFELSPTLRGSIGLASEDDFNTINSILQICAQEGLAFGVDEFRPDGSYNYNLLPEHNALVAKVGNEVAGFVVFGPSHYIRSRRADALTLHAYLVVNPKFRRQGLGRYISKAFTMYTENTTEIRGVVTETPIVNLPGILFAKNVGMSTSGVVPNQMTLKEYGPSDSMLFHKFINHNVAFGDEK